MEEKVTLYSRVTNSMPVHNDQLRANGDWSPTAILSTKREKHVFRCDVEFVRFLSTGKLNSTGGILRLIDKSFHQVWNACLGLPGSYRVRRPTDNL